MKRQYLGDSKDSFKWDYLNFLLETLMNVVVPRFNSRAGDVARIQDIAKQVNRAASQ
jgi:hypothetical protein